MLAPLTASQGAKDYFAGMSPMKRMGDVSDIGDAVALISSESARWISGQSIVVAVCIHTPLHCLSLCISSHVRLHIHIHT
jgi:hypothetical protein